MYFIYVYMLIPPINMCMAKTVEIIQSGTAFGKRIYIYM